MWKYLDQFLKNKKRGGWIKNVIETGPEELETSTVNEKQVHNTAVRKIQTLFWTDVY